MKRYKMIGTTDERTSCDCCGRVNLKKTVVLEDLDSGEFVFFGTTCAAKASGWTVKEVRKGAEAADDEAAEKKFEESMAKSRAETDKFHTWLDVQTGKGKENAFLSIEALGGYSAANALYKAA